MNKTNAELASFLWALKQLKCYCLLCCALLIAGCSSPVIDIYVASDGKNNSWDDKEKVFNTIEEAFAHAYTIRKEGDHTPININLANGNHRLSNTIELDATSGPLKILGDNLAKTTIKGSQVLDLKWVRHNQEIWMAKVPNEINFDQLFVNGEQQILARYPNYDENGGHWQGHSPDAISKERIGQWNNPKGAYVHTMHSGEWGDFHYLVSDISSEGEPILQGGHQNNRPSQMHPIYRMVENVWEELDQAGEWYLGSENMLYYWPKNGMDLANARVEGVVLKSLLHITGSEKNPAKDITIKNIHFEHTQRTFMEDYEPLLRSDWTIYRGGALFIEGARDILIENCEFSNLGGNVIFVSNFNRNVTIRNNQIHDCGASAISFVGSPQAVRSPSFKYGEFVPLREMDTVRGPKTNNYPSHCNVENNLIHRIGRIEKQTAGVEIAMAMDISVSHNSIYDVPRAGINIGDGTWGGHLIEYNDVFNTVLESGDHGAFNSWGRDRFWHPNRQEMDNIVEQNPEMPKWDAIKTTIIRNNRFRCDHGWDIDLDDGSSNYKIYNNLCLNGGIKLREGFYRQVENNIMLNNGFHPHVWFKNSDDIFKRNIVFTEHKDIRLDGWGKEVDFNFFPDKESLLLSQDKGVDGNSAFGDALFIAPDEGNFELHSSSGALELGFKPFKTDRFGVTDEKLKAIAKTPEIPVLFFGANSKKSIVVNWLGAKIKNIESMAERSASGLDKTAGVLITSIDENGILTSSNMQVGDVIVGSEGEEVNTISDLMKSYQSHNWKGKINITIIRNQSKEKIVIYTKK